MVHSIAGWPFLSTPMQFRDFFGSSGQYTRVLIFGRTGLAWYSTLSCQGQSSTTANWLLCVLLERAWDGRTPPWDKDARNGRDPLSGGSRSNLLSLQYRTMLEEPAGSGKKSPEDAMPRSAYTGQREQAPCVALQ